MAAAAGDDEYIVTARGTRVHRTCSLCGSSNVVLNGKSVIEAGAMLRGDLARVTLGRHCVVGAGTVLRPPFKDFESGAKFVALSIGNHVTIGRDCVIEAATIGTCVSIGDGCILSKCCVVYDNCDIRPGAVLAPGTVVPPFSIVTGTPARVAAGELEHSFADAQRHRSVAATVGEASLAVPADEGAKPAL